MRSVWFIWLIWFVLFNQINKTDRRFFYTLLQYKDECADIHVATGIDLLTKFYL